MRLFIIIMIVGIWSTAARADELLCFIESLRDQSTGGETGAGRASRHTEVIRSGPNDTPIPIAIAPYHRVADETQTIPSEYVYQSDLFEDGRNVFVVGRSNSDDVIKNMTQMTGLSIATLERRMRGGGGTSHERSKTEGYQSGHPFDQEDTYHYLRKSGHGQLLPGQGLQEILLADNHAVRDVLHTNHQRVAEPLLFALNTYERAVSTGQRMLRDSNGERVVNFTFQGRRYSIVGKDMGGAYFSERGNHRSGWIGGHGGVQGSPFNDEIFANWEYTIRDEQTGETLSGDAVTPHLIYRYQFYQGGPYRMAPENIVRFFRLRPNLRPSWSVRQRDPEPRIISR